MQIKKNLSKWLGQQQPVIFSITQLEVLGEHKITQEEISFAKRYFSLCQIIPIEQVIIYVAIDLRQQRKMSVGDSIDSATILNSKSPLTPSKSKNFKYLSKLSLIAAFQNQL